MGNRLNLRPLPAPTPKDELDHELVSLDPPDLALPDFYLAGKLVGVRRFNAIANLIFERRGRGGLTRGDRF